MEENKKNRFIKNILSVLTYAKFGKAPDNIEIDSRMSVNKDGELDEETVADVNIDEDDDIRFVIKELKPNDSFMKKLRDQYIRETEEFFDNHYKRMGLFIEFNEADQELHGTILNSIEDIEATDFLWLCDQFSYLKHKLNDDYLTCRRAGRIINGKHDEEYQELKTMGCCTPYDEILTNDKTGNQFIIGCNYKHVNKPSKRYEQE